MRKHDEQPDRDRVRRALAGVRDPQVWRWLTKLLLNGERSRGTTSPGGQVGSKLSQK